MDSEEILGLEKTNALNGFLVSFDFFIESNYSSDLDIKDKYIHFLADFSDFLIENQDESIPEPQTDWTFDVPRIVKVNAEMESSRMRHEIKLFPHERYRPTIDQRYPIDHGVSKLDTAEFESDLLQEEVVVIRSYPENLTNEEVERVWTEEDSIFKAIRDSSMFINSRGLYLHSLLSTHSTDTFVGQYVEAREIHRSMSLAIFMEGHRKALEKNSAENLEVMRTFVAVDIYYELVKLIVKQERAKTAR